MDLTVCICTHNRAAILEECLRTLAGVDGPAGLAWEVLVVANACSDETEGVVRRFAGLLPVRTTHEAQPGLSHARNRGVQEARGRLVAWIDDDVLVDPGWLAAYHAAAARHPLAVVFGGPIVPEFDGNPPPWLLGGLPVVGPIYGAVDYGAAPIALGLEPYRVPFGGNFVMARDTLRQHPFDPRLGRHPLHPERGGEETILLEVLLRAGVEGWWVPDARVRHRVPVGRQTTAHVRAVCAADAEVRTREALARGGAARSSAPLLAAAVRAEVRYRISRLLMGPDRWVRALVEAGDRWGTLRGYRGNAS